MRKKILIIAIILITIALISVLIKINKEEKIKENINNKISILLETEEGNIKTSSFPSKEEYYFDKIDCTNLNSNTSVTPSFNKETWKLNVSASSTEKLDGDFECNIYFKENPVFQYDYTSDYEEFTAPMDGKYKIELWGAQGKPSSNFASYTSGEFSLNKNDKLYVYVGGRDAYNGGASAKEGDTSGGATDVRLVSGSWDNITSLRSRIMVAAGSANDSHGGYGAPGGGIVGYDGIPFINPEFTGSDSTGKSNSN